MARREARPTPRREPPLAEQTAGARPPPAMTCRHPRAARREGFLARDGDGCRRLSGQPGTASARAVASYSRQRPPRAARSRGNLAVGQAVLASDAGDVVVLGPDAPRADLHARGPPRVSTTSLSRCATVRSCNSCARRASRSARRCGRRSARRARAQAPTASPPSGPSSSRSASATRRAPPRRAAAPPRRRAPRGRGGRCWSRAVRPARARQLRAGRPRLAHGELADVRQPMSRVPAP